MAAADYASTPSGNQIFVLLSNADGTFQTNENLAVGSGPQLLVPGDFNGDGHLDLAVVDTTAYGAAEVSVLLGNGDGTFQPARTTPLGVFGPFSLVAGDFNGDGRLDLAFTDAEHNTVEILLGNGDGTFQPAETVAAGIDGPLVAGDFNGDGRLDLAVANEYSNDVSVLLGNGDGTFQPQLTYAVGGLDPQAVVAGDFNGDGKLDLAVMGRTDPVGGGAVAVVLGNGDGTFQPATRLGYLELPYALVAGDFNGDGRLDLAVAGSADEVLAFLGNGDGTFQPGVESALGTGYGYLVAGDFTGDGRDDLAMSLAAESGAGVSVLLSNGDGTFQSQVTYAVGDVNVLPSFVAGDFNGRLDLAIANDDANTVSMLLGEGDGTFADPGPFVTTPHATPLVADVNGDGTDDVLVVDGSGDILYRQGIPGQPGTFEPPVTVNPNNPSRDIAWMPNTAHGPVLASVDVRDNAISFYAYRNGVFVQVGSLATGRLPAQIIAANLSGNGGAPGAGQGPDLVVRNAGDGTLSVYFESQFTRGFIGPVDPQVLATGFLPAVTLPAGIGVSDVQAIDTTGSGALDLVVTNKLTGQVSVMYNLGNGTFASPVPYRAGTGLSEIDPGSTPEVTSREATAGVAAAPLMPGSPTSLVTINPGSKTMDVLAGLGGGRFANPVTIQTASPAQVVRMGDFTGNGIDDLAVLTANELSIYLGDGKGGFLLPPTTYKVPAETDGLTVADVNGDGKLDLLVGDAYGDVLVLLGKGDGTFAPYREANQAIELAVAALAGTGSKDIIYADQGLDRVVVDYGAGNSSVLANQSTGLLDPGAVKLADLNGDGIPDLIVANSGSNNVLIYPGLGNGQFGPAVNGGHGYFVGTNPVGITVANLTGALPDLVIADEGSNDVSVLVNQSQGQDISFAPAVRFQAGLGPVATVVQDVPGGYPNLLVSDSGSNKVTLLPGSSPADFDVPAETTFPVGNDPGPIFLLPRLSS